MVTKEDLIKQAGVSAPDLMEKTAAVLAIIESVSPDDAAWVARDVNEVAEYTVEKLAAMGTATKWGLAVGSGIVAGIANDMAGDLYAAAKRGFSKTKNFNAIMKTNPELRAFDKTRLQQSFDALHRYAPEMTADPLVGGALLKSVADVPGNEAVAIKNIIDTRKNVVNPFRPGETVQFDRPEKAGPTLHDRKMDAKLRARGEALKVLSNEVARDKKTDLLRKGRVMGVALRGHDKLIDELK